MAAHRYWRATALEAYGAGDLELSCFHLLDAAGARLDASATLTASTAPTTGALANLQDDDLTTATRWPVQSVATLALIWDFGGTPVDVAVTQIAGADNARFLLSAGIQWSDNGTVWTEAFTQSGITWPGAGLTTVISVYGTWSPTDHGSEVRLNQYGDTLVFMRNMVGKGVNFRSTGTYQFEVKVLQNGGAAQVGVMTSTANVEGYLGSGAGGWSYDRDGYKRLAGASYTAYGAAYTTGDVIGVVIDFTVGSLTFYKNGVSQGAASATGMLGLTLYPAAANSTNAETSKFLLRELDFAYPVAGASAWGEKSLSIAKNAAGRVAPTDPITVGTGPTVIYGIPQVVEPVNLTVQSGAVKDYLTGVLGTGRGRVSGVVREKGTPNAPVYRKVRLIREKDGLVVRGDVWSDPVTGAYSFDYIDELQSWAVHAHDHTFAFRDQIASNLTLANGGVELIP